MKGMKKKAVTLYLDADDIQMLTRLADKHGDTSASRIIRELIRDYIAKHKALLKGAK